MQSKTPLAIYLLHRTISKLHRRIPRSHVSALPRLLTGDVLRTWIVKWLNKEEIQNTATSSSCDGACRNSKDGSVLNAILCNRMCSHALCRCSVELVLREWRMPRNPSSLYILSLLLFPLFLLHLLLRLLVLSNTPLGKLKSAFNIAKR